MQGVIGLPVLAGTQTFEWRTYVAQRGGNVAVEGFERLRFQIPLPDESGKKLHQLRRLE
jgi:hypothetical protein